MTKKQIAELEALKELANKKQKAYRTVLTQIEAIEESQLLPTLKKKYEGKFFRFRNSYGGNDSWWIYSHCIEVKSKNGFIVSQFETTTSFESSFKVKRVEYSESLLQHPITKAEYNKALKSFIKKATQLIP